MNANMQHQIFIIIGIFFYLNDTVQALDDFTGSEHTFTAWSGVTENRKQKHLIDNYERQ